MIKINVNRSLLVAGIMASLPITALADNNTEELKQTIADLQQQVTDISNRQAELSSSSDSVVDMSGYAAVNYSDTESKDGAFDNVTVAPIFHYNYKDLVMLETEFELINSADGSTEVALEYATIDLFLNDYVTLVAGKFISPIGQFRQNVHPSWINKLPTAPAGFGHGGAAPLTETGFQLRGGFPVGEMRGNYAVYVGNGPVLHSEVEDDELAVEDIEAEGRTSDADGNKVFGGRIGFLPISGLEVGLSLASGKAQVIEVEGTDAEIESSGDFDYDVFGADFRYGWNNLDLRGEYIQTEIGKLGGTVDLSDSSSFTEAEVGKWKTWYLQAAYKVPKTAFETVIRIGDLETPHASQNLSQTTLGVNYLFASNVIAKLAYEMKDYDSSGRDNEDTILAQLAYGF